MRLMMNRLCRYRNNFHTNFLQGRRVSSDRHHHNLSQRNILLRFPALPWQGYPNRKTIWHNLLREQFARHQSIHNLCLSNYSLNMHLYFCNQNSWSSHHSDCSYLRQLYQWNHNNSMQQRRLLQEQSRYRGYNIHFWSNTNRIGRHLYYIPLHLYRQHYAGLLLNRNKFPHCRR